MRLQFTAVFEKVPLGYIAYVEELPGANTQGRTLEEARSNLLVTFKRLGKGGTPFAQYGNF